MMCSRLHAENQKGSFPLGQVVAISRTGNIRSTTSKCQFHANLPLAIQRWILLHILGSQSPCRPQSFQLFGYDDFLLFPTRIRGNFNR